MRACLMSVVSLLLTSLFACGVEPAPEPDAPLTTASETFALETNNGSNLNGSNLNGSNLNGTDLAGILASVSATGGALEGVALQRVDVEGSELVARMSPQEDGPPLELRGAQLLGVHLSGVSATGAAVSLRINQVIAPQSPSEAWRYDLQHFRDGAWRAVCQQSGGAIALAGRWDYRQGVPGGGAKTADPNAFTVACPGSAAAKCVGMGYQPWQSAALDIHHQACVRLIRADLCGDGQSRTTNGRRINLYDNIGVQQDTRFWLMEAEWDANGARCIALLNRNLLGVLCAQNLLDLSCGQPSHFGQGTLMMSETPLGPLGGLF